MVLAAITTFLCHLLKQPVVIGYLLAGVIAGPHTPPFSLIKDVHSIHTMAELGLVFLMFALGLEFNLAKLRKVGTSAALATVLEVIGMMAVGVLLGRFFGWNQRDSFILGAILSISSTTIIVKVLMDLKLLKEEFSQVVFGILILEDIVAIVMLTLISGLGAHGSVEGSSALMALVQVCFFVVLFLVIGLTLVPRLVRWVGHLHSREMLGITALGLCLASALLANHFGYSVALGGFLMGSIIGVSSEIDAIEEWIHPIRDMFSAIFFVSAGLLIDPAILWTYKVPILIITVVTILGKTFSGSLGSLLAGFPLRTSLKVGMSLAQIGEFSFVIASVALKTKLASEFLYPLAVAVSGVTTLCTPYLIRSSDVLSNQILSGEGGPIKRWLTRYERWVTDLKSGPSGESRIFARYLVRLLLYVILYVAILQVCPLIARALPGVMPMIVFWSVTAIAALPFMFGVARYSNHFLLLALTEATIRLKASRLLMILPINRLYNIAETLMLAALGGGLLIQARPYLVERESLLIVAAIMIVLATLGRSWMERAYRFLERLLDEAIGLASSEPLRRAALAVEASSGALNESVERLWLEKRFKAVHQTIRSLGLREKTGASLIAIYRGGTLTANPSPEWVLLANDIVVILGNKVEREKARLLLQS